MKMTKIMQPNQKKNAHIHTFTFKQTSSVYAMKQLKKWN
jgi:hypothetical protein